MNLCPYCRLPMKPGLVDHCGNFVCAASASRYATWRDQVAPEPELELVAPEPELSCLATKDCVQCGEPFVARAGGSPQKYCSDRCANRAAYKYEPAPSVEKTCGYCGGSFMGNGRQKYCSDRCKSRPIPRTEKLCVVCGGGFQGTPKQRTCSSECSRAPGASAAHHAAAKADGRYESRLAAQNAKNRERPRPACPVCSNPILGSGKTCSDECRRIRRNEYMAKYMRDKNREHRDRTGESMYAKWRDPEKMAADFSKMQANTTPERAAEIKESGWKRRRARKLQLPTENFTSREIYERDGWACQLCNEPVDGALKYPDPMSPSLDHVVPLSRGGHHTRANTQLAHLTCNMSKGDRLEVPKEA